VQAEQTPAFHEGDHLVFALRVFGQA
jgi:hypothetical protein